MEVKSEYRFFQQTFTYNGQQYNVVLTPNLFPEEDGLDLSGEYTGILISPIRGSIPFELTKEGEQWRAILLSPYIIQDDKDPFVYFEGTDGDLLPVPKDNILEQGLLDEIVNIVMENHI